MNLVKASNGLLETENFYLYSSFSDFLGVGKCHRDFEKFYLDTNDKIERKFLYPEFNIEFQKENWENIQDGESVIFYVSSDSNDFGIVDSWTDGIQHAYQKIVYSDNYLQMYISDNGTDWKNIGGQQVDSIKLQGFKKTSKDKSLVMLNYKVYKSPFIYIENFDADTRVELYSFDNTKITEKIFSMNQKVEIFLNHNISGYFKFFNKDNSLIYQTSTMLLQQGDTYVRYDYNIDFIYMNNTLNPSENTELKDTDQMIKIKNKSDTETYKNLTLSAENDYNNIITFSTDGINYSENLTIESLAPQETFSFYINLTRSQTSESFSIRDFLIKIS